MKTMRKNILTKLCLLFTLSCAPMMSAQLTVDAPDGLLQRKSAGSAAAKHDRVTISESDKTPATPAEPKRQQQPKRSDSNSSVSVSTSGNKVSVQSQTVQRNITGYRVQVYFSSAKNGRSVVRDRAKKVAMKYPQYRTYISYVAPQWRLRVGDFKDSKSAQHFAKLIKSAFPDFRREVVVVPDKINVWGK